ncbi:MAG: alpha/beta fold hydrolase [Deltaproteobacteria bacterium]|nr:MAG: alpha/beta fold hydrolase [Deltaproteobacteria bacterium]
MEPVRTHTVVARDGWRLSVRDVGPEVPQGAVVVAGHAMMVDGRTILRDDRPCLGWTLAAAGHRVLVPDLRGHGDSGPTPAEGGRWTYDDLVADVACYLDLAQRLAPGVPVGFVGHSLFGHVSLAAAGTRPDVFRWPDVCGIVALGVDVWLPGAEPDPFVRAVKHLALRVSGRLVRSLGRFPSRALRIGSCDEPAAYWAGFDRLLSDGYVGDDGTDYAAAMTQVSVPVLHVVSHGDRFLARPASALALTRRVPQAEVEVVGRRGHVGATGPGHMALVTDPTASRPVWHRIASWLRRKADAARAAAAA